MRKQTIRIYLLFLLASLAMLTHFSALCCLNRQLGSFALWRICSPDGEPTTGFALWIPALSAGEYSLLKRLDLNFILCYLLLFLHIFSITFFFV